MEKEKTNSMLKIVLYQLKAIPDSINDNITDIINFYNIHQNTDLIITPELALSGALPHDYLFNLDFQHNIKNAIALLQKITKNKNTAILLGTPIFENNKIYNGALLIQNGAISQTIYKQELPHDGICNQSYYFQTNQQHHHIINYKATKLAIFIGEDMQNDKLVTNILNQPVDLIVSLNASAFSYNQPLARQHLAQNIVKQYKLALIYLNIIGGVDDIIFDGTSFVVSADNQIITYLHHAKIDCKVLNYHHKSLQCEQPTNYSLAKEQLIYDLLILGLQDFIKYTQHQGVIIGISGGIDSTLSATIAVDALGAENVLGIALPSQFTSDLSKNIIKAIANNLKIKIHEIPIESYYQAYQQGLQKFLDFNHNNIADNLQARIRANILMIFSNNLPQYLLLTTGNKSEIATGYSTLYGDTCGAFNLLKDLYKTEVFALSKWRNFNLPSYNQTAIVQPIPTLAITRKPSAELHNNQFDEDSLMDYAILDKILYDLIELEHSVDKLYQQYQPSLVDRVITLVQNSQYKRQQSAPGIKLSSRAFAKEFNYNITSNFNRLNYNLTKKIKGNQ